MLALDTQAAYEGEGEQIVTLVEQIESEHAPLAATLKAWAHEFHFDRIVDSLGCGQAGSPIGKERDQEA